MDLVGWTLIAGAYPLLAFWRMFYGYGLDPDRRVLGA